MLDQAALRQLRLELSRQYPLVGEGLHIGTRNLQGYEIGEARPYQYGDSWRQIDHRLTARTSPRTYMVRQRLVEHDVNAVVIADLNKRSEWGGSEAVMFGSDAIRAVSTAVCYVLEAQGDNYGIHLLGSSSQYERPRRGTRHYRQLSALIEGTPVSETDKLADHLSDLSKLRQRRELVIIVSAFRGRDWHEALRQLARRHEVLAFQVLDDWDKFMPNVGPIPKMIGGKRVMVHTEDPAVYEPYNARATAWLTETERVFREAKVRHEVIGNGRDWLDQIITSLTTTQRHNAA